MTMTAQQAADFLRTQVAWEPGLTVSASALWASLNVRLEKKGTDSSAVLPDGSYPSSSPFADVAMNFSLSPDEYGTPEVLLYHVIRRLTELHEHEIREFTRVRDGRGPNGWTAPFHPHNADGRKLWDLRGNGDSGITPWGRDNLAALVTEIAKEKGNDSEG
jgi:hypothetical protein